MKYQTPEVHFNTVRYPITVLCFFSVYLFSGYFLTFGAEMLNRPCGVRPVQKKLSHTDIFRLCDGWLVNGFDIINNQ